MSSTRIRFNPISKRSLYTHFFPRRLFPKVATLTSTLFSMELTRRTKNAELQVQLTLQGMYFPENTYKKWTGDWETYQARWTDEVGTEKNCAAAVQELAKVKEAYERAVREEGREKVERRVGGKMREAELAVEDLCACERGGCVWGRGMEMEN